MKFHIGSFTNIFAHPINSKDIQSNKKVIITELPFNVIIFQSIKINQIIYKEVNTTKTTKPTYNK